MTAVENAGHRLGLAIKLEAEPSRHRVAAVRRELRKTGAFSLGQGIWAVPDVPVLGDGVERALALTEKAGGQAVTLTASRGGPQDAARLREPCGAARSADWAKFPADCGRFEEEPAKEIRIAKFTLAELEEEEQSPERLRGRHRDLTARDLSGTPGAARAGERLGQCTAACEDYAERVFAALHEIPADQR
ncbi:Chromate resistance protein ChrB [Streptomyces sp. BK205]|uniref:Chromate resistance protein ChrB n=1 Tax=Streptomyces TaxID=1883 RepID=UPI00105394E6|nr:Chromate resistance protein ChrB [Streptomyces sp. BK205]